MRGRALAVIDTTRVSHMGLVIRRVEVHTIPAAREEYLCSEAIRANRVIESWSLRLTWAVEVEAKLICFSHELRRYWRSKKGRSLPKPRDGLRCGGSRVVSGIWVSCKHTKPIREGFHSLVRTVALEIVSGGLIKETSQTGSF